MAVTVETELWQLSADGEIVGRMPSLTEALGRVMELEAQIADLERERRGERARTRLLLARLDDNRSTYPRRDEVLSIFGEWQEVCGHKNARLTPDRFDCLRALLDVTKPAAYPREFFSAAIAGAAFDAYTASRKNGSVKRFDELTLIFRDGAHAEDFAKRAPTKENTE